MHVRAWLLRLMGERVRVRVRVCVVLRRGTDAGQVIEEKFIVQTETSFTSRAHRPSVVCAYSCGLGCDAAGPADVFH